MSSSSSSSSKIGEADAAAPMTSVDGNESLTAVGILPSSPEWQSNKKFGKLGKKILRKLIKDKRLRKKETKWRIKKNERKKYSQFMKMEKLNPTLSENKYL